MKCEGELINMTRARDKEITEQYAPSSVQGTYHIWTQLNDLALHESS